ARSGSAIRPNLLALRGLRRAAALEDCMTKFANRFGPTICVRETVLRQRISFIELVTKSSTASICLLSGSRSVGRFTISEATRSPTGLVPHLYPQAERSPEAGCTGDRNQSPRSIPRREARSAKKSGSCTRIGYLKNECSAYDGSWAAVRPCARSNAE